MCACAGVSLCVYACMRVCAGVIMCVIIDVLFITPENAVGWETTLWYREVLLINQKLFKNYS